MNIVRAHDSRTTEMALLRRTCWLSETYPSPPSFLRQYASPSPSFQIQQYPSPSPDDPKLPHNTLRTKSDILLTPLQYHQHLL